MNRSQDKEELLPLDNVAYTCPGDAGPGFRCSDWTKSGFSLWVCSLHKIFDEQKSGLWQSFTRCPWNSVLLGPTARIHFTLPLHLGISIWMSYEKWKVSVGRVCRFQFWLLRNAIHHPTHICPPCLLLEEKKNSDLEVTFLNAWVTNQKEHGCLNIPQRTTHRFETLIMNLMWMIDNLLKSWALILTFYSY